MGKVGLQSRQVYNKYKTNKKHQMTDAIGGGGSEEWAPERKFNAIRRKYQT